MNQLQSYFKCIFIIGLFLNVSSYAASTAPVPTPTPTPAPPVIVNPPQTLTIPKPELLCSFGYMYDYNTNLCKSCPSENAFLPGPVYADNFLITPDNQLYFANAGQKITLHVTSTSEIYWRFFPNYSSVSRPIAATGIKERSEFILSPSTAGTYIATQKDDACGGRIATVTFQVQIRNSSVCDVLTYSSWTPTTCPVSGFQTRTLLSRSPANCFARPILTKACKLQPECTNITLSPWSPTSCISGASEMKRNIVSTTPTNCVPVNPVATEIQCSSAPTCTNTVFTPWSQCIGNMQRRSYLPAQSQPEGCRPVEGQLYQSCTTPLAYTSQSKVGLFSRQIIGTPNSSTNPPFKISATGFGPLSVEWYKVGYKPLTPSNKYIISNGHNRIYNTLNNAQDSQMYLTYPTFSDIGEYYTVVRSADGKTLKSDIFRLLLKPESLSSFNFQKILRVTPRETAGAFKNRIVEKSEVRFKAVLSGHGLTAKWFRRPITVFNNSNGYQFGLSQQIQNIPGVVNIEFKEDPTAPFQYISELKIASLDYPTQGTGWQYYIVVQDMYGNKSDENYRTRGQGSEAGSEIYYDAEVLRECTFQYSNWSPAKCSSEQNQTRTVLAKSPTSCYGVPELTRPCHSLPLCYFDYTEWSPSVCPANGLFQRSISYSFDNYCQGVPVTSQNCSAGQTSCRFQYSAWSPAVCPSSGIQSRQVISSLPQGCLGAPGALTKKCIPDTSNFISQSPEIWPVTATQYIPVNGNLNLVYQISDVDTSIANLIVSAQSSNPFIIPPTSIRITGSNSYRTLQITPLPNQLGSAFITVSVSDGKTKVDLPIFEVHIGSICQAFTYSSWTDCNNGSQTRTISARSPANCLGGYPEPRWQTCTGGSNNSPKNYDILADGTPVNNGDNIILVSDELYEKPSQIFRIDNYSNSEIKVSPNIALPFRAEYLPPKECFDGTTRPIGNESQSEAEELCMAMAKNLNVGGMLKAYDSMSFIVYLDSNATALHKSLMNIFVGNDSYDFTLISEPSPNMYPIEMEYMDDGSKRENNILKAMSTDAIDLGLILANKASTKEFILKNKTLNEITNLRINFSNVNITMVGSLPNRLGPGEEISFRVQISPSLIDSITDDNQIFIKLNVNSEEFRPISYNLKWTKASDITVNSGYATSLLRVSYDGMIYNNSNMQIPFGESGPFEMTNIGEKILLVQLIFTEQILFNMEPGDQRYDPYQKLWTILPGKSVVLNLTTAYGYTTTPQAILVKSNTGQP